MNATAPPEDSRKTRSDGAQSRERLLLAAMRLFAEQGFARTSTREIALAARTNIAAISYYFGDKAGLYRAAFTEPAPQRRTDFSHIDHPDLTLRQSLTAFYQMLVEPFKQGDMARLCMRMLFREMLEPTGIWTEEINSGIKPSHAALTAMLCRHLGVAEADDATHRLAFCVAGLAIQMIVSRDVIDAIRPQLLASDAAVDESIARLVDFALAMVGAEQQRLASLAPNKKTPKKRKA